MRGSEGKINKDSYAKSLPAGGEKGNGGTDSCAYTKREGGSGGEDPKLLSFVVDFLYNQSKKKEKRWAVQLPTSGEAWNEGGEERHAWGKVMEHEHP